MNEGFRPESVEKARPVWVEIGPGYVSGESIIDRLSAPQKLLDGDILYVAVDERKQNLGHVRAGAVMHKEFRTFARENDLDGAADKIFMFNVLGEPVDAHDLYTSHSRQSMSAVLAGADELFEGLSRKLGPGGQIIIGEHITPQYAKSLLEQGVLKRLENSYGLKAQVYNSETACESVLKDELHFSQPFVKEFTKNYDGNTQSMSYDSTPFVLVLTKVPTP